MLDAPESNVALQKEINRLTIKSSKSFFKSGFLIISICFDGSLTLERAYTAIIPKI